jgi:hypothetical protein
LKSHAHQFPFTGHLLTHTNSKKGDNGLKRNGHKWRRTTESQDSRDIKIIYILIHHCAPNQHSFSTHHELSTPWLCPAVSSRPKPCMSEKCRSTTASCTRSSRVVHSRSVPPRSHASLKPGLCRKHSLLRCTCMVEVPTSTQLLTHHRGLLDSTRSFLWSLCCAVVGSSDSFLGCACMCLLVWFCALVWNCLL